MASFWYLDWTGNRKKKKKEGFERKKDAQDFEREFLLKAEKRCDMSFASLVQLYQEDADHRVRGTTRGTQDSIINTWLLPFFGKMSLSEITPAHVRKWQNGLIAYRDRKGNPYSATYLRTINNQHMPDSSSCIIQACVSWSFSPWNTGILTFLPTTCN